MTRNRRNRQAADHSVRRSGNADPAKESCPRASISAGSRTASIPSAHDLSGSQWIKDLCSQSERVQQCAMQLHERPARHHTSSFEIPFSQFQILFHSLLKVLFIFPSQYFFAIDFQTIFRITWNLPRLLHCNFKQCDSSPSVRGLFSGASNRRPSQDYHFLWFDFPVVNLNYGRRHRLLPSWLGFKLQFDRLNLSRLNGKQIATCYRFKICSLSISFAITKEIIVIFFSNT